MQTFELLKPGERFRLVIENRAGDVVYLKICQQLNGMNAVDIEKGLLVNFAPSNITQLVELCYFCKGR